MQTKDEAIGLCVVVVVWDANDPLSLLAVYGDGLLAALECRRFATPSGGGMDALQQGAEEEEAKGDEGGRARHGESSQDRRA